MKSSQGNTDVKNRLLHSAGEGEGEMIWQNSIETCTLPCRWPVQVQCISQGTQSQGSGTTQRVRWVGRWKCIQDKRNTYWFRSVTQSCPTLCDPIDCSTPGFPVHHQLQSLLKLMSIETVMPPNHLILCCALLLPPLIFPRIRVF